MGRNSTGIYTTNNALAIKLSFLIKEDFFIKDKEVYGELSWTNQIGNIVAKIAIRTNYTTGGKPCMKISYKVRNSISGQISHRDEFVYLESLPSNLGKGAVLYFICPDSGNLCRVLYRAYESPIWKSLKSYNERIYYPIQISSKLEYNSNKYWGLENKLLEMKSKKFIQYYKGVQTKRSNNFDRVLNKMRYLSKDRFDKDSQNKK
ncbi:hypothetical protein GCM10027299_34590 [Larkinella ripae]